MEPVTFTPYELGQLVALLGPSQLSKLSPELRQKLRGEFKRLEHVALATDEEPDELQPEPTE